MFDSASILAALLILLLTWYIGSIIISRRRNYPPGPFRLPIVGNTLSLLLPRFNKSFKLAKMLQKYYGNVASLYFGVCTSKPGAVVLSDVDTIKEAMNAVYQGTSNPIIDRPKDLFRNRGVKIGLTWAKFHEARSIRRWVSKIMKNFGAFDGSAVSKIDEELDDFLDLIDLNCEHPWNPRRHLMLSIGAITHNLLFGRRPTPRDSATYLSDIANLSDELYDQSIFTLFVLPSIPILNRVFPTYNRAELNIQAKMETVTRQEIETRRNILLVSEGLAAAAEHMEVEEQPRPRLRRSLSETPPPSPRRLSESSGDTLTRVVERLPLSTDFIAHYLNQEKLGKAIDAQEFSNILADMMIGALESVPDQITWVLFYLAHMPDEQERLYNELKANVKPSDSPGRLNMHKFVRIQAFLNEVFRHSTIMPLVFHHETNHELTLKSCKIPADTMVWYSIYSVHYDRRYWGDPENFRPDRWLTPSEGRLANHSSHIASFGIGNRICPAEQLARLEVFAYIVGILQRYQLSLASSSVGIPLSKDEAGGLIRKIPKNAEFIFTKRTLSEDEGNIASSPEMFDF